MLRQIKISGNAGKVQAGLKAHRLGTRASANTSGPDFTEVLGQSGRRTG